MTPSAIRLAPKVTTVLGLVTVIVAFYGAIHFIHPFYTHMYPFAWYGLILFIDGILWWKWNESLIFKRPREFVVLCFWSAVFWFFFEMWNLRLENWYYVGVTDNPIWAHVEAYLDFATVLPGMFLIYRLLEKLKIPGPVTTRQLSVPHMSKISLFLGATMLALPAAFPNYFYFCIWGAFIFLFEPILARAAAPSLLKEVLAGDWTRLIRLLAAGLFAGLYWELCNFWSLERWVYTVPFFSEGKLFEMPYLGFLGFPPFCVECFVMTNTVYLLRGGRHWLPEWHRRQRSRAGGKTIYLALVLFSVIFAEWSYDKMTYHTVDSRAETIKQALTGIDPSIAERLTAKGLHYPKEALHRWEEAAASIPENMQGRVRNRLVLVSLLYMGSENARLLEHVGIDSRDDLAQAKASKLFQQLSHANDRLQLRRAPLLERRVMSWIVAAQRTSPLY